MKDKETGMRHPASRAFLSACEGLAEAFCRQLGVSGGRDDAWWITPGEMFAFQAGQMFTGAEEMLLALEHGMDYGAWSEWYWQWTECGDDGGRRPGSINLRSWLMGARPGQQPPQGGPQEVVSQIN